MIKFFVMKGAERYQACLIDNSTDVSVTLCALLEPSPYIHSKQYWDRETLYTNYDRFVVARAFDAMQKHIF